jgi:hypothetical protein
VDEAADDVRLPTCRTVEDGSEGSEGKLLLAGEKPWRAPLDDEGACSCANAVEMGVRPDRCCCLEGPHGCCWLI